MHGNGWILAIAMSLFTAALVHGEIVKGVMSVTGGEMT
jgi:hypothetical protein